MERFEDTPGLFGCGSGSGTLGEFTCPVCGTTYNKGCCEENDYKGSDEYIGEATFAGMSICRGCFGEIEYEVLQKMPDILKWYGRILNAKRKDLFKDNELLESVITKTQE